MAGATSFSDKKMDMDEVDSQQSQGFDSGFGSMSSEQFAKSGISIPHVKERRIPLGQQLAAKETTLRSRDGRPAGCAGRADLLRAAPTGLLTPRIDKEDTNSGLLRKLQDMEIDSGKLNSQAHDNTSVDSGMGESISSSSSNSMITSSAVSILSTPSTTDELKVPSNFKLAPEQYDALCKHNDFYWHQQDEDGDTMVMKASANHMDHIVMEAALNCMAANYFSQIKNKLKQTILHIAAMFSNATTVRFLLTRGGDPTLRDSYGYTALHHASERGDAEIVKALTDKPTAYELVHPIYKVPFKGAPSGCANWVNNDGKTALHLAVFNGHKAVTETLAKLEEIDIDQRQNHDGDSIAHIAIKNGDMAMLDLCLRLDVDSEVRNHGSETPQQLAQNLQKYDMVKLCQKYGADPRQLENAQVEEISSIQNDCDQEQEPMEVNPSPPVLKQMQQPTDP